jgi:Regulator of G protein signaling domain
MCEENLEFLQACYKYQEIAARLYPNHMIRANNSVSLAECDVPPPVKRSTITNEQFEAEILECKKTLDAIVGNFIRPDSSREVNLPVYVRKPFLLLHQKGIHHPDLINESMEHIVNMLRQNTLSKFLTAASKNEGNFLKETPDDHEKFTIKQIVLNFVPKPYSRADFLEFLKKEVIFQSKLALRRRFRISDICYRISQILVKVFSRWISTARTWV